MFKFIIYTDRPNSDSKNRLLAVAVPELTVEFSLPFDSFAPAAVETVFKISTSLGSLAIYIPKYSPVHQVQKASYLAQESFQDRDEIFRLIIFLELNVFDILNQEFRNSQTTFSIDKSVLSERFFYSMSNRGEKLRTLKMVG